MRSAAPGRTNGAAPPRPVRSILLSALRGLAIPRSVAYFSSSRAPLPKALIRFSAAGAVLECSYLENSGGAASGAELHRATLVAQGQFFADVLTTEEWLQRLIL